MLHQFKDLRRRAVKTTKSKKSKEKYARRERNSCYSGSIDYTKSTSQTGVGNEWLMQQANMFDVHESQSFNRKR